MENHVPDFLHLRRARITAEHISGQPDDEEHREYPGDGYNPELSWHLLSPFFLIEATQDTFALFCEGGANASFPSGHASRATVFGMVLGFVLSQKFPRGCYLLLLYPILMSISRIYVLQHFPMDVIGGAILGILLTGVVIKKAKLGKIFESKI